MSPKLPWPVVEAGRGVVLSCSGLPWLSSKFSGSIAHVHTRRVRVVYIAVYLRIIGLGVACSEFLNTIGPFCGAL